MFDETKTREFYLDFLGFSIEFEHRFEADLPLYLGLSRNGLQLHLSEHHGDASPGSTIFVPMRNIELLRDELLGKRYGYGRPDIVEQGWGESPGSRASELSWFSHNENEKPFFIHTFSTNKVNSSAEDRRPPWRN